MEGLIGVFLSRHREQTQSCGDTGVALEETKRAETNMDVCDLLFRLPETKILEPQNLISRF
jgi:hypothetical protein